MRRSQDSIITIYYDMWKYQSLVLKKVSAE